MTELHDEAVTVQTMALLEAHIAAFTLVWHSKPTSHSSPTNSSK